MKAYITGVGVVSPAGRTSAEFHWNLVRGGRFLTPLRLFDPGGDPLPVGQMPGFDHPGPGARTHGLALAAARAALAGSSEPPEAIVLGTTTGGIFLTETLLLENARDPEAFRWHTPGSVAALLAETLGCRGPVLTVSTACSSGTVILKVALELIRQGRARRVLVVGADSLCRLTYHGFHLLQIVDPAGARPLDRDRRGMSVAEAAGALLLEAGDEPPAQAMAGVWGAGLSCDAFHLTAPHAEGLGAALAMQKALRDAGLAPERIDYINLHGTGTPDNDSAEAAAIRKVFASPPPLSSTKGAYGHPLAAAGAVEAIVAAECIRQGVAPPNTGCADPDPRLGLTPLREPLQTDIRTVLSNSFGFGGNNASVVLAHPSLPWQGRGEPRAARGLRVRSFSVLTAAGGLDASLEALEQGRSLAGTVPEQAVEQGLQGIPLRRLKRLARLALSLSGAAHPGAADAPPLSSIYFATGMGALSETFSFLSRLFKSGGKFSSPTDFVGSLHSSPAGQLALAFRCMGPNLTATGPDDAFEQALFLAELLPEEDRNPILLAAADEAHEDMSPLLDRSAAAAGALSDGGAAFVLEAAPSPAGPALFPLYLGFDPGDGSSVAHLVQALRDRDFDPEGFGAVLAGIPESERPEGEWRMEAFLRLSGFSGPVLDYRRLLGQHPSVSATACAVALGWSARGAIPGAVLPDGGCDIVGKPLLLLGLGRSLSAVLAAPGKRENQ